MSYILNIETATTVCSVSLSKNGEVLAYKELDNGFTHAENLHIFIDDILKEAGIDTTELNAIAVSKGPGSYTGLRIGVSAAKGLAYALSIPLISIDTLQVMSQGALLLKNEESLYCPMIDARRREVYTGIYDKHLKQVLPVEALILDETSIQKFAGSPKIYFFGDGIPKCRELLQTLPNAAFIDNVFPSARYMGALADQKFTANTFEDTAYFEPFYLKDFLMTTKKK